MSGTFEDIQSFRAFAAVHSPYLRGLLETHADFAASLAGASPDNVLDDLLNDCTRIAHELQEADFRKALRHTKSRAALLIALADLSGLWDVDQTTAQLTRFADAAVQAALHVLLVQAHHAGKLHLADVAQPAEGCGYVVIAMGKHGAHELNYSSDIDLIILYDPETAPLANGTEPSTFFVRLTRNLVALLQDMTEDGYVFRVDLRLRPDPRATQVAIAVEAAAIYYENLGQNWERAAMIKARPAAGDIALGVEFLARLQSYIWRKYLDFAAIADVQSLKRQIHAVKGHGEIAIRGHNLKLGRGGIREIEFFVQTQQLIAGGRNKELRGQQTVPMLQHLAVANWISPRTAADLTAAYRFLRTLEHRVQMLNDAQDHCVPSDDAAFENYARFCGFTHPVDLETRLRATLETVQRHYQALFESAADLAGEGGSLVFTGGEDDPETVQTLQQLGFHEASEMSATIRGWHFGRYNATRTKRSRELLTELMPQLLKALAQTGDADHAFLAFDRFLQGLPAGVQLFSMLKANPQLLDLIARILGTAPRLAQQLSRQPRILEAVLDRSFFRPLPTVAELAAMASAMMPDDITLEEVMDRARILGREQMFRVGVRILSETVNAGEAGAGYSNIADLLLRTCRAAVIRDIEQQHGKVPGGVCAIIAMGKLGSREMTATSDLDLILVYDSLEPDSMSDGPRPLSAPQYYARLTQRMMTAITAPTAEGLLYDVDMRLRPSGSKGPVAVSHASFSAYQKDSAWTWEKMALTRARLIAADPQLDESLRSTIAQTLCAPRDAATTLADARDMRSLMLREHKTASRWDIKKKRGGLVDLEFVVQILQLLHAHRFPVILHPNTLAALQASQEQGLIDPNAARDVCEALGLYSRITQILRLSVEGEYDPARATPALNQAICRAALMPDIPSTEALLDETAEKMRLIFNKVIGEPASD
jgi:[glutamine synthetase] adenylyltransferase / [glutamine synthetase]-adenylyl-L-tyrosine phosphorylase